MRSKRKQSKSSLPSRRQSQALAPAQPIEQPRPRENSDGMIIETPIVTDMFLDKGNDQLQLMLDEDLNETFVSKRKGSTQFFFKAEKIEERLIRDTLGVLKGVFDCEEQHSFNSHQDYFRLFEIAVGILENYRHDEETLRFSPNFMSGFLEILRTDTNHEFISGKAIMAIANDLITTRYKYHLCEETGARLEIPLKKLAELVNHMIEVVDGLFIDPLKSVFLNHIPDFAKEVAENELWENLAKLPDEYNSILNNALVLLCDILTEMPETMTNSAIGNLVGTGVIKKFNHFAKSSDDIDYETLSFILQLGCKVSVVPGGMEI